MGKKSLRVLHIDTQRTWRGGQQQVFYLLDAMVRQGYDTQLICQPGSRLANTCARQGLPFHAVKMRGELDFGAGLKIAIHCKNHNFRIVHCHSAHALAIGLWAKLFHPALKLIAVRRVDFHIKKNWFSRLKYRTSWVNKIVCISRAIQKVMIEDAIPPKKLALIYSGIDIHKFDHAVADVNFRQKFGIPGDHIVVGTVAAMVRHKDYPSLLKAAKIVIQQHDQVSFCALGDGPRKQHILNLAEQLQLGSRFIFAGFQEQVGGFLRNFDIFVLASLLEGLGTSILDAQAVGLPIVACHTGGIAEIVLQGRNGLLVAPGNEKQLAKAILTLVRDAELRKKFGANSLQNVKKFDIKNTVAKNIELYNMLCSLNAN